MAVAAAQRRAVGGIFNGRSRLASRSILAEIPGAFDDVTTFRQHYTAVPFSDCRRKLAEPLPPASVIHQSSHHLKIEKSLTQDTYTLPRLECKADSFQSGAGKGQLSKYERASKQNVVSTNTHIVPDRRLDALRTTTTQEEFPPIMPEQLSNAYRLSQYRDLNSGPFGRRLFNALERSEYSSGIGEGPYEKGGGEKEAMKLPSLTVKETKRNTLTGKKYIHVVTLTVLRVSSSPFL